MPLNLAKKSRCLLLLILPACFTSFVSADDDLTEDGGAWMQAGGESSLELIGPSLKKGRLWIACGFFEKLEQGTLASSHTVVGTS